ncbi:SelB C-terminal domain-containing protein [Nocardioides cavernae]|uniref:SelB domain-containing protein n=1 Tax=Nocardioides cavernae TaxID=1921566 RepID=UPI00200BBB81|nr:SelB C-terminal domain-containing protein [Nocardioides cavernae]MCK9826088.1 SelB C-terminal domain-containing protein [Nocardioides cavernae]
MYKRQGVAHADRLRQLGVRVEGDRGDHLTAGPWLVDAAVAGALSDRLPDLVAEHARAHPLDPAVPLSVLAARLRLPSPELVRALVRPPLRVVDGRVLGAGSPGLPDGVRRAVDAVLQDLAAAPFAAPTADRLRELGLDERALGAAERGGLLKRVGPGIVLAPASVDGAVDLLRDLDQPFTTSAARERLGTTRRVVLPLLDHLDRAGRTRRLPDDRREVVG